MMTIAKYLDQTDQDAEEDFIKAGGVKVCDEGREFDNPWYRFPDGSCVWLCHHGEGIAYPFFDWGMGHCLPE